MGRRRAPRWCGSRGRRSGSRHHRSGRGLVRELALVEPSARRQHRIRCAAGAWHAWRLARRGNLAVGNVCDRGNAAGIAPHARKAETRRADGQRLVDRPRSVRALGRIRLVERRPESGVNRRLARAAHARRSAVALGRGLAVGSGRRPRVPHDSRARGRTDVDRHAGVGLPRRDRRGARSRRGAVRVVAGRRRRSRTRAQRIAITATTRMALTHR